MATKYLPIASADQCGKVTYAIPVTGDEQQYIGRIDFVQSEKHTIYGRYLATGCTNPPIYDGNNLLTTTRPAIRNWRSRPPSATTYTFGPGTLNSFHFGFNRMRDNRGPTPILHQSDHARRQHVQRRAQFPAELDHDRRLHHLLRHLRSRPFQHQRLSARRRRRSDPRHAIRSLSDSICIRIQNNTISGFEENG